MNKYICPCGGKLKECSCKRGKEVGATTPHWHCEQCNQIYDKVKEVKG